GFVAVGIAFYSGLQVRKAIADVSAGGIILTVLNWALSSAVAYLIYYALMEGGEWLWSSLTRVRRVTPEEARFYSFVFRSATGDQFNWNWDYLAIRLQRVSLFEGQGGDWLTPSFFVSLPAAAATFSRAGGIRAITFGHNVYFNTAMAARVPAAN